MNEPVKTYTLKVIGPNLVWEFKYNLEGYLKSFEILEGQLSEKTQRWLFHPSRFPYTENACKSFKCIKNVELLEADLDLSFDVFWNTYNRKVGKKVQAQNSWKKLSKSDKILALKGIKKYDRYLSRKHGVEKAYPSTYLNQRQWKMNTAQQTKKNNRRYYLHRQIKKKGVRYNPALKTVYWPFNQPLNNSHVKTLQCDFDYSVQTEIE